MEWCAAYASLLTNSADCSLGDWAYVSHLFAVVIVVGLAVGGTVGLLRSFLTK